jgi:effector-binding domain-containing protein
VTYEVEIAELESTPIAAVTAQADPAGFPRQIRMLFDQVYAFLRSQSTVRQAGHNVIIYEGPLRHGSRVTIGVQVDAAFEPAGAIVCTATPAGRVARTVHVGAYAGIVHAHDAVVRFCNERGLKLAGRNWEVYGDWYDDPAKLRTDVHHLLE